MQKYLSVKKRIIIVASFYFVFATMYWLANSLQTAFEFNMWKEALVDYTLKGFLTIPIWYLIFVILKNKSLAFKLKIHLITCPLYVFLWFFIYRIFAEPLDLYYLKGTGRVWDVYIPTLFYFLQFGFFHAYEYWVNYQYQLEREEQLNALARVAEINTYKAQLQPHFLFNTLNSINATLTQENESTREMIAKLADTFRYALTINEQEFIPLKEEIAFNRNCLELEQIRFSDRLQVIYNIDESLLDCLVPPMILQPLIENAIKHGISKSIQGGTIAISVEKNDDNMFFEIVDTGLGLHSTDSNSTGIGLSNTKKRLEILYGEALLLEENKPQGVKVSFRIPIKKGDEKN
jgi:two-component system, LytTR family, sensor kinase